MRLQAFEIQFQSPISRLTSFQKNIDRPFLLNLSTSRKVGAVDNAPY
jgi:hypothetical protein